MKIIKWTLISIVMLILLLALIVTVALRASLPTLDAEISNSEVQQPAVLSRDPLGTAIIKAASEKDAAYLLGYAHAQDRLFQMDLMRRQSAGELSEIVGTRALTIDKKHRFHQFRKRAAKAFDALPEYQQHVLKQYTKGVNAGAKSLSFKPFEYLLTGSEFSSWVPEDSLLTSYSMYIDLQLAQTEIDFRLTALKEIFGAPMYQFFTLPSHYQSAIDNSLVPIKAIEIPNLPTKREISEQVNNLNHYDSIAEQPDYGSNNWAVAGRLTASSSAMLSNDMHLGLGVPAIWYRAQLNYTDNQRAIKVTGVSLPGTPAIIVGSNGHIAWGFTNSNVDNVDWVKLEEDSTTTTQTEEITTPDGIETYSFEMSQYGPVREFNGQRYALKWVAHQDYAVNLQITNMAKMVSVKEALHLSKSVRIPVQNMVVADSAGNVAYQLTGAMSKRAPIARHAISEAQYNQEWESPQFSPANLVNPSNGRVWSANARVIGTKDLVQFGDGGYELGARQQQIANLLIQQETFSEADFYAIQLNNKAIFLSSWQNLLIESLRNNPLKYQTDIEILKNWGACACADSVGYTLVRRFRSTVINQLLEPVNQALNGHDLSTSYLLRGIEPAVWALLQQQPQDWLPADYNDYATFLRAAYDATKQRLIEQYEAKSVGLSELRWGNVNALHIKHPFSASFGPFSGLLDMAEVEAFGDSNVPAVHGNAFGASQRLIVRPGNEDKAILTIPGGQSGHFLSPFYRAGFDEYATAANTPLLPLPAQHKISFVPSQ